MSAHRFLFYCTDAKPGDETVTLSGDEHHHLSHVLRIASGAEAFVTNGRGMIATCRVESLAANSTCLRVLSTEVETGAVEVTLALALIKKDRFAQALEQCVEVGVARVVPFVAERSHVRQYGTGTMERFRRIAVSAMKQSFRSHLPEVADPVAFGDVVEAAASAERAVVGDTGGPRATPSAAGAVLAIVGPEAGLTGAEMALLTAAGASRASVSPHRLRAETAATVLVAALRS
jgi:16S rRNA (uracil1498-N3)-methyltransferase